MHICLFYVASIDKPLYSLICFLSAFRGEQLPTEVDLVRGVGVDS